MSTERAGGFFIEGVIWKYFFLPQAKKGREVDIGEQWRSAWNLASSRGLVTGGSRGGDHQRPLWKKQEGAEYEEGH